MTFSPSPEQRAILEYPLTSLRIAAGAGTGKTTTLAHRISHLILHGIEPEQILGITFTNKAAEELAERVTSTLADSQGEDFESARQVDIHTYHGFAATILREFGPVVGVERATSIATPTFSRQLFHDALEGGHFTELDVTYRGIVGKPAYLAATMGDHLVSVDDVRNLTPDEPDRIWRERAEVLGIIERYQSEKRRIRVVDHSDLIAKAHELVHSHPEIADRIRDRYRAVFLDEYQDTNAAQREMLRGIFTEGFPVTAVGDADQTIYEWRGASLENFAGFQQHFPQVDGSDAASLPLSINRRSGHLILDVANVVRASINEETRIPLAAPEGSPQGEVATQWFATAMDEAVFIATQIQLLASEGLAYKDMAILFRKNKDTELVRATLEDYQIPVEVVNLGGLLGVPEVSDVHAWLRLLHDPGDNPALLRVLLGARYRIGMADLKPFAQWTRNDRDNHTTKRTLLEGIDQLTSVDDVDNLTPQAQAALFEFRETYRSLLAQAQGVSLVGLVRRILSATGAWQEIEAMEDAARLSARLNLYRLLDLAEEWSPLEGRPSLEAFLDYLSVVIEDQTEEIDTARLSGEDAVLLVTIHRAKGLEWDTVFIPAVYHGNFPTFSRGHEDPVTKSQVLPYQLRLDRDSLPHIHEHTPAPDRTAMLKDRHQEQETRLAYVGITRARERLFVTGAAWYGGPEPRKTPAKPSSLFEMLESQPGVKNLEHADDGPRPTSLRIEATVGAPDPTFPNAWDGALRSTIEDPTWPRQRAIEMDVLHAYDDLVTDFQETLFSLPPPTEDDASNPEVLTSVTSLVTLATCPKRYYWSEVDPLPRRASAAARRGTLVHRKIELHARGVVPLTEVSDEFYDLDVTEAHSESADTEWGLGPYEAYLQSRFSAETPRHIEAPFRLKFEGGIVRGRVDAIYGSGESWEIVDFKSGRNREIVGTDLQLKAYAVAAKAGSFGRPPQDLSVTFAYLGGGVIEEVTQVIDDDWLSDAKNQIDEQLVTISTGTLAAGTFNPEPSPACLSCDFSHVCEPGKAWLTSNQE